MAELQILVRGIGFRYGLDATDLEDLIQDTLVDLMRRRRATRSALEGAEAPTPPNSDAWVRNYLRRALINNAISILRRRLPTAPVRTDPPPDPPVPPPPRTPPWFALTPPQRALLCELLVPAVAAGLRGDARPALREAFGAMIELREGRLSIEDLLPAGLAPANLARVTNDLHQLHCRTRRRLIGGLLDLPPDPQWSAEDMEALVRAVQDLRAAAAVDPVPIWPGGTPPRKPKGQNIRTYDCQQHLIPAYCR